MYPLWSGEVASFPTIDLVFKQYRNIFEMDSYIAIALEKQSKFICCEITLLNCIKELNNR